METMTSLKLQLSKATLWKKSTETEPSFKLRIRAGAGLLSEGCHYQLNGLCLSFDCHEWAKLFIHTPEKGSGKMS